MKFEFFYQFVAAFNLEATINATSDNANYESGIAELGAKTWHVRTARTTPSKPGAVSYTHLTLPTTPYV